MTESTPTYKVSRVARERDLPGVEDELAEYWTRDDDSMSLRELATYFNEAVLRSAMESAGIESLDGEVANTYRLLTDDEVSSGVRTETRKQLERNGVDVDRLESDFVTYQAVRTYLREGRDVTYERPDDQARVETVAQTLGRLQNRTATVTETKLEQLRDADRIDLGEFRVLLDLQVFCQQCETQYGVGTLLERGGCDCQNGDSAE
ncbi:rod-determining factor RdfA [Halorussus amylolyticus]|uniref:rod-determining factor RdfA n=1 Tax=Halorussus amylolyticus TaxID=1126242 RepID=UPI001043AB48|nr:rod-determining factor RdfA [Halorussus amylolyticus]